MKKIDLGPPVSVLANLGVLVGIFLLVYELNQARDFARNEYLTNNINTFLEIEREMMNPDMAAVWAKAALDPASLTPGEIRVMDAYLLSLWNKWRDDWRLEQDGFLEPGDTYRRIQASVSFTFGSLPARAWWEEMKKLQTDRPELNSFNELIDEILADANPSANREYIERIQRLIEVQVSGQSQ